MKIMKRILIAYLAVTGFFAANSLQAQELQQINLPNRILSSIKKDHPRLMVTSYNEFEELKQRIPREPFLQKCQKSILRRADSILTQPVNEYTLKPSKYLLNVSRSVLDRTYILALEYRLTGDRRYADRLWQELNNAASFPDWDPTHFLGTAEMTHAFAIAYDWLFDTWTSDQKKTIRGAILNKGLEAGDEFYQGKIKGYNWTKVENNWNVVCNGSMIIGALAIGDEESAECQSVLQNALTRIPKAMRHYGPDGAWFEGPTYTAFTLKYNVALIACLQSALGTDFGLSDTKGFSNSGKFLVANSGPTGITFNYGDGEPKLIATQELFWLGTKFNEPGLINFQEKYSRHNNPLEMLWYKNVPDQNVLPLSNYFRGAEVATLRSDWTDTTALFVAFKAGQNGANHGHLDIGSFVLEKFSKRWVVDLGADSYKLPGYFKGGKSKESSRWTYFRVSTEGHNTLVVKNGDEVNQNPTADARIVKFNGSDKNPYGIIDMTPAYTPQENSVKRGIKMIDKKQIVVQDEVSSSKPNDVYWQIETPAAIDISADGKVATMTIDDKQMQAVIISPGDARFQSRASGPLIENFTTLMGKQAEGVKRLMIHLDNISQGTITVVFKEVNDNINYRPTPLSAW